MKNKKGAEFAIGTVVMIVLGLAVLIILILVVRQQVTKGSQGYSEIGGQAKLDSDNCKSIILGRSCVPSVNCDTSKGMKQVYSPLGQWKDCKAPDVCCENA